MVGLPAGRCSGDRDLRHACIVWSGFLRRTTSRVSPFTAYFILTTNWRGRSGQGLFTLRSSLRFGKQPVKMVKVRPRAATMACRVVVQRVVNAVESDTTGVVARL